MRPNRDDDSKLTPPMQTIPGEALYDTLMSVSYTHLTLPTIYSV